MRNDVLIVGGGLAGLTAGVALARAGRRVRLSRKRTWAGEHARSRTPPPAAWSTTASICSWGATTRRGGFWRRLAPSIACGFSLAWPCGSSRGRGARVRSSALIFPRPGTSLPGCCAPPVSRCGRSSKSYGWAGRSDRETGPRRPSGSRWMSG
ncbi:MAG: hypothetical protein DMG24_16410 [Acidobacteria bacterium]|nr:MAG: hypothetical protein DMG24_16410 [Acidobacteriota bacterium]